MKLVRSYPERERWKQDLSKTMARGHGCDSLLEVLDTLMETLSCVLDLPHVCRTQQSVPDTVLDTLPCGSDTLAGVPDTFASPRKLQMAAAATVVRALTTALFS